MKKAKYKIFDCMYDMNEFIKENDLFSNVISMGTVGIKFNLFYWG